MKKAFVLLFISFSFFQSCSRREISDDELNSFIKKYDSIDFKELKNIFIHQRSVHLNEIVYIINKFDSNLPVYFVTYDTRKGVIKKIDNSLLQEAGLPEYFTAQEINSAIQVLRKYRFALLGVDSLNNVFINPYRPNDPPFFMRLNQKTGMKKVMNGYSYQLFKDRWYIRK
jgi:hypothetical protein